MSIKKKVINHEFVLRFLLSPQNRIISGVPSTSNCNASLPLRLRPFSALCARSTHAPACRSWHIDMRIGNDNEHFSFHLITSIININMSSLKNLYQSYSYYIIHWNQDHLVSFQHSCALMYNDTMEIWLRGQEEVVGGPKKANFCPRSSLTMSTWR